MKAAVLSALILFPGLPAAAQSLSDHALSGLQTCAARFPDSRATSDDLKESGWRYEGNLGGTFHLFTRKGRRVVMGISTTAYRHDLCVSVVSKLPLENAISNAQRFIEGRNARRLTATELKTMDEDDVVAAWIFELGGKPVILAATKPVNLKIIRGAALMLIEAEV